MSTTSSRTADDGLTELDGHVPGHFRLPTRGSQQPLDEDEDRALVSNGTCGDDGSCFSGDPHEVPHPEEPTQLNTRTLRRMQRAVAGGNIPLRADLLGGTNLRAQRTASAITAMSCTSGGMDAQSSGCDTSRAESKQKSNDVPLGRAHDSVANLSMASVESMCGSTVMPNILNRKNLDFFSAQLLSGGARLRQEFLSGEDVKPRGGEPSEMATADLPMSLWTEGGGSEHLSRFISQSDIGLNTEETRQGNAADSLSEATNPRTPANEEGMQSVMAEMGTFGSSSRIADPTTASEGSAHKK